jgi:predicted O-methyltransferase YrrM
MRLSKLPTEFGTGPRATTALLSAGLRLALRLQEHRIGSDWLVVRLQEAARLGMNREEMLACLAIRELRAELAIAEETVQVRDFGAGTRSFGIERKPGRRKVSAIYRTASASPAWGRFLFRLARGLRPKRILELGTNLGVSACHLQVALDLNGDRGTLTTIEGDPVLADLARGHLLRVHRPEAGPLPEVEVGRFDDVLPEILSTRGPFNLVFLDGHHEEAATKRYFGLIEPHLSPGALVVFDDIEPWRPVRRAWRAIREERPHAPAVDFLKLGLLVRP